MSDLEQQLADELDHVANHLRAPDLAVAGLVAAGRREQQRGRALVGGLVATVVVAVLAIASVLPGGDGSPEPARPAPTTGTDDALGRPLELPWAADGVLHVDGAEIEVVATRIVQARGVTLVEHRGAWSLVVDGGLSPLSSGSLAGDPVVGTDGTVAWIESPEGGGGDSGAPARPARYVVNQQAADGARSAATLDAEGPCCDGAGAIELVGIMDGGRLVVTRGGILETYRVGDARSEPVVGVPGGTSFGRTAARPGGLVAQRGSTVVAATLDAAGRWQPAWETAGDGSGAWSEDGEQYAEAAGGEVRFATRAGTTSVSLAADRLRVVGWESAREVVVAQWIDDEGRATRLWRCSATQLRCEPIDDGPTGRMVLPGL